MSKPIDAIIANPRIALSAITGEPHPETTMEDRAERRARVAQKAREEEAAMEHQRQRIRARQSIGDRYYDEISGPRRAANDNAAQRVAA